MQISLYVGGRKKKDKIVNQELLKYIEGDRSDRIKDLILKGLIFEGKSNIDEKLLDMRYMYNNNFSAMTREASVDKPIFNKPVISRQPQVETGIQEKPDFSNIKIKRGNIPDDDLENRI